MAVTTRQNPTEARITFAERFSQRFGRDASAEERAGWLRRWVAAGDDAMAWASGETAPPAHAVQLIALHLDLSPEWLATGRGRPEAFSELELLDRVRSILRAGGDAEAIVGALRELLAIA